MSALDPEAMGQLEAKVAQKEALEQARVVLWDDIKNNPPKVLEIPWIAMTPLKM